MTDIPLNTYIEWAEEDRERGECPVPAESDVTVWFEKGEVVRDDMPEFWAWDECIIAYMVHSMPQQRREFWLFTNGHGDKCVSEIWRENAIHVREVLE